jgi:predicted phage-related endonuclease
MPEIIYPIDQGTDEWFALRCGSIGGTIINQIAPGKTGYRNALYTLAGEVITEVPAESDGFKYADRGNEFESMARALYSLQTGNKVEQCALIKGDEHTHISPDGLIGDNGLLEIKTRTPKIFLEAKEKGYFQIDTKRQIAWGLLVSGRDWYDYTQFCPEIENATGNGMIIERIYRDTEIKVDRKLIRVSDMMNELKEISTKFIAEMMDIVKRNS